MERPVCVDVCPTRALELVDLNDVEEMLRQRRREVSEGIGAEHKEGLWVLDLE